ncbi:MAG: BMP family ABC transporter substrate-binding protein [Acidimicrobiia bacterium]|nr:BMP family ABC transporter substrate-binding protein [Acidimicrobiia bacterium]NNL98467.1 BMP family ABC transporter substrate-binding protein [Acidimicrobiia bacterium]
MHFQLLGPLRVSHGDAEANLGGHKQRVVLAGLLLNTNRVVGTDELIEWVWGEDAPRTAAHSIQIYVSELRRALRPLASKELIVTREPGYVLEIDEDDVDVDEFERLVSEAALDLQEGRPNEAAERARAALGLWHGPALSEFRYDEFAQSTIRRLDDEHLAAQELLTESELATGRAVAALTRIEALVEAHPLRESATGLLMQALYRNGRAADALGTYQRLRHRLGDELGVEPSPHLQQLEDRILIQDPSLGQQPPSPGSRNPYKGLRPFGEDDAADFFGRTALLAQLTSRLRDGSRFLSLVGPSGSGKSSAVRAGLIPALRENEVPGASEWAIAVMTPGSQPIAEAVAALRAAVPPDVDVPPGSDPRSLTAAIQTCRASGVDLLLVVDQFEELFTLVDNELTRQTFLDILSESLAAPGASLRLVITLRGDFYDRPLLYEGFGPPFAESVVSVMPLTPSELGEAAAGPAQRSGVAAEPQLIAALVADVAGRSGALPLFQYTLTDLFDRRSSTTLTLEDYQGLGGLEGALVGRAEAAFATLTPSQQTGIRQVMLRMVRIGPEAEAARRQVPVRELSLLPIDGADLHSSLNTFGALRLLSFDRSPDGTPTVEIAHEALLDTWGRFRHWIDDNRADLRKQASLAAAVSAWSEAGHDADYLPAGAQLAELELWVAATDLGLTEPEHRYLEEARRRRLRQQEEAATAAAHTRRLTRRARLGLIGLAILIVAGLAGGLAALILSGGEGPRVALVYAGRGDQAFGDLEASGWDRALRELTFQAEEIIPIADSTDEIESAAAAGFDLIISGGILHGGIAEASADYPDTSFVQIDMVVDGPNVTSYLFAQNEGSYLAGVAAALETRTGTVGFLGGMNIPIINEFRAGFEAGVRATDPTVTVLATYPPATVTTPFARADIGAQAGHFLMDQGADVVFAAAGITGWGVLDAIAERTDLDGTHRWYIGADVDQYLLTEDRQRPHVLTSMVKRVDEAVHRAISDFVDGELEPGTRVLGVAEGGVGLAASGGFLDQHQAAITAATATLADPTTEIPIATGPVIDMPEEPLPATEVIVTFDGETCDFAGLEAITLDEPFALVVTNTSEGDAFTGFIPVLDETLTFEDLQQRSVAASANDVPDHLDLFRSQGMAGPPGIRSVVVTLDAGHWGAFCTTATDEGNVAYPAALIELG